MSVLAKSDEKVAAVRTFIVIYQILSFMTCGTEDMFGADDGDWAIYRKIVCIIPRAYMRHLLRFYFSEYRKCVVRRRGRRHPTTGCREQASHA